MSILSPFDRNDAASQELNTRLATNSTIIVALGPSAAPAGIALMRERDARALSYLFDIDDIDEIEADIGHHLFLLNPYPALLEDPFDFLHGYL